MWSKFDNVTPALRVLTYTFKENLPHILVK